jgi:aspartate-semialdehyde dehydrogenase
VVSTYQAISGASKSLDEAPEIIDNVIPYIGGEEEKSEQEPLKIWGDIKDGKIVLAEKPLITSQCIRIPVSDGHLATVFINFNDSKNKPSKDEIINLWTNFKGLPQELNLPSAPKQFIKYFEENDRPQTKLDRDLENGMAITAGRLREDNIFDYKFIGLSHNTIRGAAGGGVLTAELLYKKGYIVKK